MGVVTLKLDDALETKLRERASRVYGLARGSLSRAVEDALAMWLQSDASRPHDAVATKYEAFRDRAVVVEAQSLRELAGRLKRLGIDPRDVEIRSSEPLPAVEKLGLRVADRAA
jgi:regulator of protease activity HflC (stomatin/prohibitin superfamily)